MLTDEDKYNAISFVKRYNNMGHFPSLPFVCAFVLFARGEPVELKKCTEICSEVWAALFSARILHSRCIATRMEVLQYIGYNVPQPEPAYPWTGVSKTRLVWGDLTDYDLQLFKDILNYIETH